MRNHGSSFLNKRNTEQPLIKGADQYINKSNHEIVIQNIDSHRQSETVSALTQYAEGSSKPASKLEMTKGIQEESEIQI
jgi:hypothetical protein